MSLMEREVAVEVFMEVAPGEFIGLWRVQCCICSSVRTILGVSPLGA